MEVIHRVSFNKLDNVDSQLEVLGVSYKRNDLPGGSYIIHFEIKESDPNWLIVENIIKEKNGADFVGIVFTNEEILKADYSRLLVNFEQGYPYPEGKWQKYKVDLYNDYCSGCGVYREQKGNFRIKKEFYTRNQFVSLMWSSAAVFCSSDVINTFYENKISGFTTKAIYLKNSDEKSNFQQIIVAGVIEDRLLNKNINFEICKNCGTRKYDYIHDNYLMYNSNSLKNVDFQKTNEWFGSGLNAFRQFIVSRRVAKVILDNKWKGVKLEPLLLNKQ